MNKPMIAVRGIEKVYNEGLASEVRVLKGIDMEISKGEFVVIMGPSGSGKTTLLDIVGCLLRPTRGELSIDGARINFDDDAGLAGIRRKKIGFVFQQYNLISSASALDNVELPMRIAGKGKVDSKRTAEGLLKMVGLEKRLMHRPGEMSGGEQQRVAIARSLANNPEIILADEPTGNLDSRTGEMIMNLLMELNNKGYTIITITHDPGIKKYADRVIGMKDGKIDT